MKNWHEAYRKVLAIPAKLIDENKGIIVGFNVNIDKIIKVKSEELSSLITTESDFLFQDHFPPPRPITSSNDLLLNLVYAIKSGRAEEVILNSNEVSDWIEQNFSISKLKLGGQAGIIANLMKKMGLNNVLLSLPTYNSVLSKLIDPEILTILEKNGDFMIQEIGKLELVDEGDVIHYIFEYKEGEYKTGDQIIKCNRANRFIVSFDNVNSHLKFHKGLLNHSSHFIEDYSLAILSGFHLINSISTSSSYRDAINPVVELIKSWKEINPKIIIHLETASTQDIKLREEITNLIFPLIDSVGMNEQELLSLVEVLKSELAKEMQENMSSSRIFDGMYATLQKFPEIRIHLHNLGYFLILSKPKKPVEIKRSKHSLLYSSLFAAVKARNGRIESIDDILDVSINLSKTGYEELINLQTYIESKYSVSGDLIKDGHLSSSSFSLIGIPTIVIEDSSELVGLGDTISSISVLLDTE